MYKIITGKPADRTGRLDGGEKPTARAREEATLRLAGDRGDPQHSSDQRPAAEPLRASVPRVRADRLAVQRPAHPPRRGPPDAVPRGRLPHAPGRAGDDGADRPAGEAGARAPRALPSGPARRLRRDDGEGVEAARSDRRAAEGAEPRAGRAPEPARARAAQPPAGKGPRKTPRRARLTLRFPAAYRLRVNHSYVIRGM